MTYASMPTIRDWMLEHPGWVTTPDIYHAILCPCPVTLPPRTQASTVGTVLCHMAELGVTERMPYDRAILGEPETRVTWMWRLTEEGKAYSFRRASGAQSVRDTARAVSSRPDDDAMDRLIEVLQGRNPMLCATIAREMGSYSYALSGLLRRACNEGKVKRFTRRGASYFMLDYREE